MNIIFFGAPASGKGTQAKLLAQQGFLHLSTGDMLRTEVASGSNFGKTIHNIISEGKYVSDEIVDSLIAKNIETHKDKVFDGYPRTIAQVQFLENALNKINQRVDLVINFTVDAELLFNRISKRYIEQGRSDDNPKTFKVRLSLYEENTIPVINYFKEKGLITPVDGGANIDTVAKIITTHIGWTKSF